MGGLQLCGQAAFPRQWNQVALSGLQLCFRMRGSEDSAGFEAGDKAVVGAGPASEAYATQAAQAATLKSAA